MTSNSLTSKARRELILKALHGVFQNREFSVADILKLTHRHLELIPAFDEEFGHGFFKTDKSLHPVRIGRFLQQKLVGKRFGDLELFIAEKGGGGGNRYRIGPPTPPKKVEYLVVDRTDADGRIHREILMDKNGEPLLATPPTLAIPVAPIVDKPAEPSRAPPGGRIPKIFVGGQWREMTEAEQQASSHHARAGPGYSSGLQWTNSITPNRGNFNL